MEKLESNGITAWVERKLKSLIDQIGKVTIDHRSEPGGGGYLITTGDGDCSGGCDSC